MGFTRNRSIVDNARKHEGQRFVYNIDLKDFFPSIDQARIEKCLQLKPFNLTGEKKHIDNYTSWSEFKGQMTSSELQPTTMNLLVAGLKGFTIETPIPGESLAFYKGKGRLFAETVKGKIFVAKSFDPKGEKYILVGSETTVAKDGTSLKGTYWLVNRIPERSRYDIAADIAYLCCTSMEVERENQEGEPVAAHRKVLPQGAPTSPVLTNIVCQRLDHLLTGLSKRFGLRYTRYADDITFSSMHNVYQQDGVFILELKRIIKDQGFIINQSKTRLQKEGFRQEVTGLIVNERVNVKSSYIKQLRKWLYLWESYGYLKASAFFMKDCFLDKGHIKPGEPDMQNVIAGKLDYLRMVKGGESDVYKGLENRFVLLNKRELTNKVIVKRHDGITYPSMEEMPSFVKEPDTEYNISVKAPSVSKVLNRRRIHLIKVLGVFSANGLAPAMKYYKSEKA